MFWQFQKRSKRSGNAEKSKNLIIHCHGGGWVAQTPKFRKLSLKLFKVKLHEIFPDGSYLKDWALKLDVPILSIDYSLAPEAPFPRALEEVFYTYCWALKNAELVGSTGENIVLVGDSAGGNLITACTIKCIEMGIKKPKGLLNIYAVFLANYVVAPSRYLGFVDVIAAYAPQSRLFLAYNGESKKLIVSENRKIPKSPINETFEISDHYLFSPHYAPDEITREFPPTVIVTTNLDVCLDEGVEFAKKLKRAEVNFEIDIIEGLHHGFLNMSPVCKFY
jgi:acetyl esterase/lipase